MSLAVIKLGSGIVTAEDGTVRTDVLRDVCAAAAGLSRSGDSVIIVSSGAIARGMRLLELGERPVAMDELQAASAMGQGKLYRAYDELLQEHDVPSAQVLLTFFDLSARSHYLNARKTLRRLLAWGVVPVINENDTTATDEITFGDNDFLAAQVAILLSADRLLLLTDTDGLYTADPRRVPSAELIATVESIDALEAIEIGPSGSALGSGGMRSKVVAAEMAMAAGIETVICNGTRPGAFARALAGERVGTRFVAQPGRASSFKLWLRYAKPTQGQILVDSGAEAALRTRGTSLLPVGVVEVIGQFEAGDAVEIGRPQNGGPVGKGIVNLSADDLRRVKGLKSQDCARLLPGTGTEAVHRDYFVLY